jgi:5,10-methylenetetrahydromethanopterin reductase
MYENDPASVEALPRGVEWRKRLDAIPANERHLAIHEDHLLRVTQRDRSLLDGELLKVFTWTGSRREVRARIDALEAAGATEILYAPMGPDIARELRAFIETATA